MALLRALVAICSVILLSIVAVADDSLPAETVQRLKNSTLYIKTELGPLQMTGSGFVFEVNGDTALIATNQHVVTKPKELKEGGYIPGLRGRDRIALARIQRALATSTPVVSAVFNSGTPKEQVIKAELLGEIETPDLAILKVTGVKTSPTPISFQEAAEPVETMPVYILGFPFGDALSTNKGNPSITIGKGSVSSIRNNDKGQLSAVQIDGAINPGNSGGPVVDAKGNLVGIAVQTIQGSNIGLAIPSAELASVLDGHVNNPATIVVRTNNGAEPTYEVSLAMIDPLKKLKSVSLRYVEGAATIDATKSGEAQLQSSKPVGKIKLSVGEGAATGKLPLKAAADQKSREITVQTEYVNSKGKTVHLEPVVLMVAAPQNVDTTIVKDGNKTTMTQTTQSPDGKTIRRQITVQRGKGSNSKPKKPAEDSAETDDEPEEKMADSDDETITYEDTDKPVVDEKKPKKPANVGWTNKIANMKKIPNSEVSGSIDGLDFRLDKATLSNTGLSLVMGPKFRGVFSEAELDITLFNTRNQDLSGRKYLVNGRIKAGDPHIRAKSMRAGDKIPRTDAHLEYMMVLEFGKYNAKDRVQPGKIYVCLPDRGKSYLAGTFEANVD